MSRVQNMILARLRSSPFLLDFATGLLLEVASVVVLLLVLGRDFLLISKSLFKTVSVSEGRCCKTIEFVNPAYQCPATLRGEVAVSFPEFVESSPEFAAKYKKTRDSQAITR